MTVKFSAPEPERKRLPFSPKVTSKTQFREFSIPKCPRTNWATGQHVFGVLTQSTSLISGEKAIRTEELPCPGDFQNISFFSDIRGKRGKRGSKFNYPYGGFIQKFFS